MVSATPLFGAHVPNCASIRQYRHKTLIALNAPLDAELRLMDELALTYLKTYQVWHHRRLLVQHTNNPAPELAFIAIALRDDAKNYHTWSYRQWILAHFNDDALWRDELAFVQGMLVDDLRNNSAWHHRFFVVFQSGVRKGDEDRDAVVRRELACVAHPTFTGSDLTDRVPSLLALSRQRLQSRPTMPLRGITSGVFWTTPKRPIRSFDLS